MMATNRIKSGLFYVTVSLIFASCSSLSTLPLEVLRPAKYSVPPDIVSVVAIDYSYPFRSDSSHLVITSEKVLALDSIWIDDFGMIAANSLHKALEEKNFFDSVYLYPNSLNKPPHGQKRKILPLKTIESVTDSYNSQAVIAIEDVKFKSAIKVFENREYYRVTLDVNGEVLWKLYDFNGYVMDVFIQRDSIFWESVQMKYIDTESTLPSLTDAITILAQHLGSNYASHLAPHWESLRRYYFDGGHHLFMRANDLIKANNWSEAAKVYYNVFETGNKAQKARAAFNIALSFEVKGDFEEAHAWAIVSKDLFEQLSSLRASSFVKKISVFYEQELKLRIQQRDKITEQIGSAGF